MSIPLENAKFYTMNKESPYYREHIPKEMFDALWEQSKQMALGYMCQLDPSHAALYQEKWPQISQYLDTPFFKESHYDMFPGCFNPEEGMFQDNIRSNVAKMVGYGRFCLERDMYKEELDKIQIKNPMYIVNLPRAGSTWTHRILCNDPKSHPMFIYEFFSSGSKTMTEEGRIAFSQAIVGQIKADAEEMDKIHYVASMKVPEEEIFFLEILALAFLFACGMPRWEQYRENLFKRDWTPVYEALIYSMKMSSIERPLADNGHFLFKCVAHFAAPIPFFNIMCSDEISPRIVWIHREPIGELSSCFYLIKNVRARYPRDIGLDDNKWLIDNIAKINEICLKNAVEARKKWIAEKPERAKQIIDIGFREMIDHPIETTKKIYNYFGMEYTEEFEKGILDTVTNKDPQGQHGRKQKDDKDFTLDVDAIREQYKWYYEEFKEYLPDYYK